MAILQNDPNVKIPAAVRRAADLAEQAHQRAFGKPDTPNPPADGNVTPEGNGDTPPKIPENIPPENIPPENGAPENTTLVVDPASAPPSPPPSPPKEPTAPDHGKSKPKEIDWERRYVSMKGRHDALQRRVAEMASEIQSLQGLVTSLKSTPTTPTATAPTDPQSAERLITPDEENEYGSELLSVVGKKAREEFLPEIRKIAQKLEGIERRVEGVNEHVSVDARARMHEVLDRELPDWRQINYDENFLTWLQLPDVYSGAIRQELLNAAYERNDTPRVIAFFKGFIADEAASAPDSANPDLAPSASPKVPLEQFAAPGRAKTAAATPPAGKPTFTRASIASFYADVSAGKYRGREADKDRIERQIFEAQQDGRILG